MSAKRLVMWLAHLVGLQTIPLDQINLWSREATERCKIAGDYEFSDARLCGINDGRSETLNRVVHTITLWNREGAL
jgi:hypothetical protein